jgi:DNA polymerase/3'-5' exonuclease PolX
MILYTRRPETTTTGVAPIQGPSLPVKSEEDIFKHLNIPYKEPSERTLT